MTFKYFKVCDRITKPPFLILCYFFFVFSTTAAATGLDRACNSLSAIANTLQITNHYSLKNGLNNLIDSRKVWLKLVKKSPTLDKLDYLTSPATQEFLFHDFLSPVIKKSIISINKESLSLAQIVRKSEAHIKPEFEFILNEIEVRLKMSVALIRAINQANNHGSTVEKLDYRYFFLTHLGHILKELSQTRSIPLPKELQAVVSSKEAFSAYFHDAFNSTVPTINSEKTDFKKPLLNRLKGFNSLSDGFEKLSNYLQLSLNNSPVGVIMVWPGWVSIVNFGRYSYSSIYGEYNHRRAGVFGRLNSAGEVDIQFNLSNFTKRKMAIQLDQGHQNLDRIFSNKRKCRRGFHTCGSYAPIFFISNGVPIFPGGIAGAPVVTTFGLIVQRILNLPHIENVRFSNWSKTSIMMIPALFHDTVFGAIEITAIYRIVVYLSKQRDKVIKVIVEDELGNQVFHYINNSIKKGKKLLHDLGQRGPR